MMILLFVGLRLTGKRGMKQLSVFELLIIIALGSATGDPMIYREVGVLLSVAAFLTAFISYNIIIYTITRSRHVEGVLEGKPLYVIWEGKASERSLKSHELAVDEFFSELRNQHVYHLGQIEAAIIETSGELGLLLYDDKHVRPGLPVWPHLLKHKTRIVRSDGLYACTQCGNTEQFAAGTGGTCGHCRKNDEWVKAVQDSRTDGLT